MFFPIQIHLTTRAWNENISCYDYLNEQNVPEYGQALGFNKNETFKFL